MLPVTLTSLGGAFPANPLPLPIYSPPVMYPLPGPGFGRQALYPETLPTLVAPTWIWASSATFS